MQTRHTARQDPRSVEMLFSSKRSSQNKQWDTGVDNKCPTLACQKLMHFHGCLKRRVNLRPWLAATPKPAIRLWWIANNKAHSDVSLFGHREYNLYINRRKQVWNPTFQLTGNRWFKEAHYKCSCKLYYMQVHCQILTQTTAAYLKYDCFNMLIFLDSIP